MESPSSAFKRLFIATLALILVAGVACTRTTDLSESEDNNIASNIGAGTEWRVPSYSMSDWVTYADQISVVTIQDIEQQPLGAHETRFGEGYVGAMLTVTIDETLWVMPGVEAISGTLQFPGNGWALHEGKLSPFNPDAQVGGQYVVAFARFPFGSRLSPIRPLTIRVDKDRLVMGVATRSFTLGWIEEHAGGTVAEFEAALAAEPIDDITAGFAQLDVIARVAAISDARRALDGSSSQD